MPAEKEYSSTMRIDIPPDILEEVGGKPARLETRKIRIRPATQKISRSDAKGADTRYEQLLQGMYDATVVADLKGQVIDANMRATDFLQFSRAEFQGISVLDIISGSDTSLIDMLCQNLQKEKYALLQAYCIRKDRSFFPAEIAVNILKFDEMRLAFFIRDVTLRRQAEEMLRTEHNAIQNAGNGIAIADMHSKLEHVNPAMLKMWGYEVSENLLGSDVRSLLTNSEVADQMVRAVLTDHQTWIGELSAKKKDGTPFDVQVSATCNRDSDGEAVGMVLSFVDISDRKRAEEALRQSERHRVMLASVGAACHHLGQPATVILTNLELIKRLAGEGNEDLTEMIRSTNEAAEHLAEILHKLNTVEEYRTVQYLDSEKADAAENAILDIQS